MLDYVLLLSKLFSQKDFLVYHHFNIYFSNIILTNIYYKRGICFLKDALYGILYAIQSNCSTTTYASSQIFQKCHQRHREDSTKENLH